MPGESVGSLNILGEANFSDIVSELDRLDKKLGRIENSSKHLNIELERSGGRLKNMTSAVTSVGGIIGGFITGLATLSPTLADEWAEIGIATFNIAERLGTQIEPEMQSMVGHLNNLITYWDSLDEDTKEWITDLSVVAGGAGAGLAAGSILAKILGAVGIGGPIALGVAAIAAGFLAWETNLFGVRDIIDEIIKKWTDFDWSNPFGAGGGQPPSAVPNINVPGAGGTGLPPTAEQLMNPIVTFTGPNGETIEIPASSGLPVGASPGVPFSGTTNAPFIVNMNIRIDPTTGELIGGLGQ